MSPQIPFMDFGLAIALLLLLLSLVLGMIRALKGPSLEDRLLSILLLGTGGLAILLLLSVSMRLPHCSMWGWCWCCWRLLPPPR